MKNKKSKQQSNGIFSTLKMPILLRKIVMLGLFWLIAVFMVITITACNDGKQAINDNSNSGNTGNTGNTGNSGNSGNDSSMGTLTLDFIRASRTECTSPCPIIFSIDAITDSANEHAFTDNGVYWDYDDDQADEREGHFTKGAQYYLSGHTPESGASKETDTNTPLGMHTYYCETGSCEYNPSVSVQNASGDLVTATIKVSVRSLNEAYPPVNTVCYSGANDFTDCPTGATQIVSNSLPLLDEWDSNTRYLLRKGEVFTSTTSSRICIAYDRENIHIGAFGAGDVMPEINKQFVIGGIGSCTNLLINDVQAQSLTVPFWNRNITLTGLRLPEIRLGMTFANLTLHNLDLDYENIATGGGRVIMENSDYCSKNTNLDCINVPLPKGLYFSSVNIIGSRTVIPGINIGLLPKACVSFLGLLDVTLEIAFEHNFRVECSSRTVVLHSDINGDHIGTNGKKHAITIRPEGYYLADMLLDGIRRSSADDAGGSSNVYEDRYIAIKDVYLGTPESVNNASRISIAPSNAFSQEVTRYAVISGNVTDMSGGSGDGPANRDVNLAGWGLTCYDDNIWETVNGCKDGGQASIPDEGYEISRTINAPTIPPAPN